MLPNALIGAIQRYKEDTDSVAAWLASTAKLCGYRSAPPKPRSSKNGDPKAPENDNQQPSGRLKGKARKEAKQKSSTVEKEATAKYMVALKDFVPMAECIVACRKPAITIPKSFVTTIDRVIRLRSSFGPQMSEHGVDVDADSNHAHCYFVGVLEKVRDTLRPRMSPDISKQTPPPPKPKEPRGYGVLPVYEPSQEFLDAPDIELPQKTRNDNTIYEAEVKDSLEDALVVWHLLMSDADKIRTQIFWIWQGYRDGNFDLTAAAIATNVGIQMVRNSVSQFSDLIEKHGGPLELAKMHFESFALQQGFSPEQILHSMEDGSCADYMFPTYDKSLYYALDLIKPLVPHTSEGVVGFRFERTIYDDASKFSEPMRLEDRNIVAGFWAEGVLFMHINKDYPVEDEFLRGLRITNETNKISFEMAFASQILLDIRHRFGEGTAYGFHTLECHTKDMSMQLDAFLETFINPTTTDLSLHETPDAIECKYTLASILHDNVPQAKREAVPMDGWVYDNFEAYKFLKLSPILSGISLFQARAEMFQLAFKCAKETGMLTCLSHLYNAVRQQGMIDTPWPDMEAFEACFETRDLFVGGKPQDAFDYQRRLLAQLGCPASALNKSRKPLDSNWRG